MVPRSELTTLAYATAAPLVGAALFDTACRLKPNWLLVVRRMVKFTPGEDVSNVSPESGRETMLAADGSCTFVSVLGLDTDTRGAPVKPSALNTLTTIDKRVGPPDATESASVSCVREYRPGPQVGSASLTLNATP